MSESDYPERFFYINEWIFHMSGIWLYNPEKMSHVKRMWQIIWTFLVYAISIYFMILELLILRETTQDIGKLFIQLGLLLTHALGILRVILILSRQDRLLLLQSSLQDENYFYEACGDFEPGKLLRKAKILSSRISILVCKISFVLFYYHFFSNKQMLLSQILYPVSNLVEQELLIFLSILFSFQRSIEKIFRYPQTAKR